MRTAALLALALAGCNGADDKGDGTGAGTGDTGHTDTITPPGPDWNVVGDPASLPPAALLSIWASSSSNVWTVGADPDDGLGPMVLHFDGTSWTRLETGTTGDLWWVWSDGGDTVLMSGEGGRMITHSISAGTFTETVVGDASFKLFGTWGTSANDVWTVGSEINFGRPSAALHYDGTAWTEAFTAPIAPHDGTTPRNIFKVWGSASDDVWFIGTSAMVLHWDGTTMDTSYDQPIYETTLLVTVHGRASDDVYAVGGPGNGKVIHFDGTTWTEETPPPVPGAIAPPFNGVFASEAHGTVTCGEQGSIWWHGDTHEWAPDSRPPATPRDFHACWIDETGEPWAVGGDLNSNTEGVVITGNMSIPPISL